MTTRVSAEVRSFFRVDGLRLGLAVAVLVLVASSRGDALVLVGLLAALSTRPTAVAALVAAGVGASWRWGSSSLVAWSGDQAVLGPAGLVGPPRAAVASWCAAVSVLLAVAHPAAGVLRRRRRPRTPLDLAQAAAAGGAAALVVAGPAPGGDLVARAGAAAAGLALALLLGHLRAAHRRLDGGLAVAAVVAGIGSVVAAAGGPTPWRGTVAGAPVGEALALAVAATAAVVVLLRALDRVRPPRWVGGGEGS